MLNCPTYEKYTHEQLSAMQKVYYAGKANKWQAEKYEFICNSLLDELRQYNPKAKEAAACYLHAAIGVCIQNAQNESKQESARMLAAAQMAHTQLKAWKWEGLK